jgi:hypothetical protein
VEEAFFLFEPPAEGGFSRSWDAREKEVHGVSLAFLLAGVWCGGGALLTRNALSEL